ncbi:MAG: helix-turn-helix transcriptional regulator [Selenomonadaceae bacterium]|nr:helix-turn-helix transcriptional regulator [Selenomonadaceae bacterium]
MKTSFKELRLGKELTQEQLIEQFNATYHRTYGPSAISMFENNHRVPEISALIDFADFFDVSLDYLLCRPFVHKQKNAFDLTADEKEHMKRYRAVSLVARQLLDAVLDYAWRQEYPE